MTKVLTIRIDPELLCRAEARAARLGLDRANYVRALIEEDVAVSEGEEREGRNRFSSEDLAGMYEGSGSAAANREVRRALRTRSAKIG
jgi:predicted DNA-binding protein